MLQFANFQTEFFHDFSLFEVRGSWLTFNSFKMGHPECFPSIENKNTLMTDWNSKSFPSVHY